VAQKANVNPEILLWARKSARISLDKAAKTISKTCKPERIREWEEGNEKPSIRQAEKLARLYRRPVDVFFLPFIPKDYPPLKDFRKNREEGYETALIFMMREIQEKQEWLSKFLSKSRERKLDFAGRYNIKYDPETVAQEIRKTLGIQSKLKEQKPLRHWIERAEAKRIFVCLSSNYHTRLKLDSDIFKGFVVADQFAPFIFINSDDWEQGQLVSLVHALAHIFIGVSGVFADTYGSSSSPVVHPVEKFCRAVTSASLLPRDIVGNLIPESKTEFKHIVRASRRLGVSHEVLLSRMADLDIINEDAYRMFRKQAADWWKDFLYKESQKKKSSGGPNYYVMALRRSSKAYSNIIMDIYKSGRISGTDASRLLKVKETNFQKFEKYIYR
jgi:Zn-dependent peptidase ImmA (M78 family)